MKEIELEKNNYQQKLKLSLYLLKLQEKEHHYKEMCMCKTYCGIYHFK